MLFDRKVTFYDEKTGKVEAEYFYLKSKCNYLLSCGFSKDSLGELRKTKAHKAKNPSFHFKQVGQMSNKMGIDIEDLGSCVFEELAFNYLTYTSSLSECKVVDHYFDNDVHTVVLSVNEIGKTPYRIKLETKIVIS